MELTSKDIIENVSHNSIRNIKRNLYNIEYETDVDDLANEYTSTYASSISSILDSVNDKMEALQELEIALFHARFMTTVFSHYCDELERNIELEHEEYLQKLFSNETKNPTR